MTVFVRPEMTLYGLQDSDIHLDAPTLHESPSYG